METVERTHQVKEGQTVDCRNWQEFEIVEHTMRGFKVRHRLLIDKEAPKVVELPDEETI